jgi:hypothetical protein
MDQKRINHTDLIEIYAGGKRLARSGDGFFGRFPPAEFAKAAP